MNREILFRGFHPFENGEQKVFVDGRWMEGEWKIGDLIQLHDGRKYIVDNKFGACIDAKGNFINTEYPFVCKVIPGTVGQHTGLTDKKGKMIFENDVVLMPQYGGGKWKAIVYFKGGKFAVDGSNYSFKDLAPKSLEVIGNKYENPELMKG